MTRLERFPRPAAKASLSAAGLALALALLGSSASAATLAELFGGGFLVSGNARFDSWQLVTLDDSAAPDPDFSLITVTTLATDPLNPGLSFAPGGQLSLVGANAIDFTFRYRVSSVPGAASFGSQTLALTGINLAGDSGFAYISEESTPLTGGDLGASVTFVDDLSNASQLTSISAFEPHRNLTVTTNIFLTGIDAGDSISLTAFTQRFAQTGPTILPGDFNSDGSADGFDFLAWQRGQSPSPGSAQDFAAWRHFFGESISAASAASAVPEPEGVFMLAVALFVAWRFRKPAWSVANPARRLV